MAVLCLIAGGMYVRHHGADFAVRNSTAPDGLPVQAREMDVTQPAVSTEEEPVNINTADAEELDRLPGIGPAKAAAILEYRKSNGYFRVPDDLMKVPGIKEGTYGKLKGRVTVGELPEIGTEGETFRESIWPGLRMPEAGLPLKMPGAAREDAAGSGGRP